MLYLSYEVVGALINTFKFLSRKIYLKRKLQLLSYHLWDDDDWLKVKWSERSTQRSPPFQICSFGICEQSLDCEFLHSSPTVYCVLCSAEYRHCFSFLLPTHHDTVPYCRSRHEKFLSHNCSIQSNFWNGNRC